MVPGTDPAKPAVGPGTGAAPRLVCVASVTPRKGQDVLVAALARLRALDWSCVVAGSLTLAPAYASAVRRQAEETGLADRIEFLGECRGEVLNGLYDSASLFVLPSHYEGYGMALAEALARGLPIVSTTGGAIPYTLPGDAAVLVPPGDVDALAVALRDLLSDAPRGSEGRPASGSHRRVTLAAAARRHAARLPSWDTAAKTFAGAILELTPDV